MNKMMLYGGILLIIVAIILFILQHYSTNFGIGSLYGSADNKWYFYGLVGLIGLIGLVLVARSYMKKETAPSST